MKLEVEERRTKIRISEKEDGNIVMRTKMEYIITLGSIQNGS